MDDFTLICGDCLKILPTLDAGSVDAVITDPPYGIGAKYSSYDDTQDNLSQLVNTVMLEILRIAKVAAITSGVTNQWLYPQPDWVLAWITEGNTRSSSWGFSCWQPILVYGRDFNLSMGNGRRPDIIKYQSNKDVDGNKESFCHPCSKPVGLMKKIIARTTPENAIVLDPFMGSGTTGVACAQLGRRFIGIEIDPGYFAIAEKRINQARMQLRLDI